MPSDNAVLKKHFITLVVSVVVLDAIVIGLYYGLHIQQRTIKTQETFVAVWVVVTLLVVSTGMRRIRQARRRR
jgi:putative Mn2+ efflux pump MntP